MLGVGKNEWESRQRNVFVSTREEYNNESNRNTYMGYILNNMGLGPGTTMKTADQVRKITDHHRDKITNHRKTRNRLLDSNLSLPSLNQ